MVYAVFIWPVGGSMKISRAAVVWIAEEIIRGMPWSRVVLS